MAMWVMAIMAKHRASVSALGEPTVAGPDLLDRAAVGLRPSRGSFDCLLEIYAREECQSYPPVLLRPRREG